MTFLSTSNQGINKNGEGKTKGYKSYRRIKTLKKVLYSPFTIPGPLLNLTLGKNVPIQCQPDQGNLKLNKVKFEQ
jgi:hypothetical protein